MYLFYAPSSIFMIFVAFMSPVNTLYIQCVKRLCFPDFAWPKNAWPKLLESFNIRGKLNNVAKNHIYC